MRIIKFAFLLWLIHFCFVQLAKRGYFKVDSVGRIRAR